MVSHGIPRYVSYALIVDCKSRNYLKLCVCISTNLKCVWKQKRRLLIFLLYIMCTFANYLSLRVSPSTTHFKCPKFEGDLYVQFVQNLVIILLISPLEIIFTLIQPPTSDTDPDVWMPQEAYSVNFKVSHVV